MAQRTGVVSSRQRKKNTLFDGKEVGVREVKKSSGSMNRGLQDHGAIDSSLNRPRISHSPSKFGDLVKPHTSAHSPGTPPGPHNGAQPCGIGRFVLASAPSIVL